jgi:hypothetical protein
MLFLFCFYTWRKVSTFFIPCLFTDIKLGCLPDEDLVEHSGELFRFLVRHNIEQVSN